MQTIIRQILDFLKLLNVGNNFEVAIDKVEGDKSSKKLLDHNKICQTSPNKYLIYLIKL